MSTYKHRGVRAGWAPFTPITFWTNQVFGHSINGEWTPSLNVSVSDCEGFTEVSFSYVGDAGDESGPFIPAKEQFMAFMKNPKVAEPALKLIGQHVGWEAQKRLRLYMAMETVELPQRPRTTREATMQQLLGIATNAKPKL